MRELPEGMQAHLAGGATTLARCWRLSRRDGQVMGFTDHDRDLAFEGVVFRAGTGLEAYALEQGTGLAVDNSQALGALSDLGLEEADIRAGRYDGAEVVIWLVNWRDVEQRLVQFRGTIGEVKRSGGVFEAELRGLSELLNQPRGRAYHRACSAVLGDAACGVDLAQPGYSVTRAAPAAPEGAVFTLPDLDDFAEGWFERGTLIVESGAAVGLRGVIRSDRFIEGARRLELWQDIPLPVLAGDMLRLEAGCDKRVETCQLKFHNFLNYQGFPHIPGEDWALSYPVQGGVNDGGSLG